MRNNGKRRPCVPGPDRGFTLVELLISMAVLSVIGTLMIGLLQVGQRTSRRASVASDSQQSARVASAMVTRDVRAIGSGLDESRGQPAIVHAGPWTLVYNANIAPQDDDPADPGSPAAMDPALMPDGVPVPGGLYTPVSTYRTGAETVRYTLDSNGDGLVDAGDNGDDPEENTPNPDDYLLVKEVYGGFGNGTNGGVAQPVAVVLGPVTGHSATPTPPLFSYWVDADDNPATPDVLHGDADGDGELSASEIGALGPVAPSELPLITRVVVAAVGADETPDLHGNFRQHLLATSVTLRNTTQRDAVIHGTVYADQAGNGVYDPDEDALLASVPVTLGTQDMNVTDGTGEFAFSVQPGQYDVSVVVPAGMVATTPVTVDVDAARGDAAYIEFGVR